MIISKPTLIRWVNNDNAMMKINKLSVLKNTSIKRPGNYNDGGVYRTVNLVVNLGCFVAY